ncbi:MAG: GNAT family N-acetyltransferase [Jatrophihabitans sp.]
MRIRPATTDDADAIAVVHVRSWQATYRGTFADEFLDTMDVAGRAARWRENLAEPQDPHVLVAESESGVKGFAAVGSSRDDDADAATGELWAIYADPEAQGTGVGRALMRAVLAVLDGYEQATLWVLTGNERAIRFYECAGWHFDGTTREDTVAGTLVSETRYRRSLP